MILKKILEMKPEIEKLAGQYGLNLFFGKSKIDEKIFLFFLPMNPNHTWGLFKKAYFKLSLLKLLNIDSENAEIKVDQLNAFDPTFLRENCQQVCPFSDFNKESIRKIFQVDLDQLSDSNCRKPCFSN